jgi:hypothetical protein
MPLSASGVALGGRPWLFCGSDRDGQRAAVLVCIAVHPAQRINEHRLRTGGAPIDAVAA